MRITPWNPPSSKPTACSIVDLPDPDGPSSATISPRLRCASTPRSTSIVTSACVKLRFSPTSSSARSVLGSFITQHLNRVGIGRLERGIERGEEAEDDNHRRYTDDFKRIGLRRQFGKEPDRRGPQRLARDEFEPAED